MDMAEFFDIQAEKGLRKNRRCRNQECMHYRSAAITASKGESININHICNHLDEDTLRQSNSAKVDFPNLSASCL